MLNVFAGLVFLLVSSSSLLASQPPAVPPPAIPSATVPPADVPPRVVRPAAETEAMNGVDDVADDVCVWVNSANPERSVIIAINKSDEVHGGLYLFGLDGRRKSPADAWVPGKNWFDAGKKLNNVDIVSGFAAGEDRWDLVCATNRTDRSIDVFRVLTTSTGADDSVELSALQLVGQIPIGSGFASDDDAPYGIALAPAGASVPVMAFISDKLGRVAQFELRSVPGESGAGQVVGHRHDDRGQPWQISESQCPIEGIVADSLHKVVYIAAEDEGIYRYQLVAGIIDERSKVVVERVGSRLVPDIEGLTMFRERSGAGYLIASCQEQGRFTVYDRRFSAGEPNRRVADFAIGAFGELDAVQATDGIDAVSADFGGVLSGGLFIAHDGEGRSPTNYKIVPFQKIKAVLGR